MTNYLLSVKTQNIVQVGNFSTSDFPWILSQKNDIRHLATVCIKWNASPSLKPEKNRMTKHSPNTIITWYCRLCYSYLVQIFTLNFTKRLLISFTRTYGFTRKEISRAWSILKTIITGKSCGTHHAVKGRDKIYLQGDEYRYQGHWVQKDLLVDSSKKETPFLRPSLVCFKPFLSTPAFL